MFSDTMNPISEYTRTRELFRWCLEENPSIDADWLRLVGTADCYCELFLLERLLLEGMEGLA